jgi:hypothetical protein
LSQREKDAEAQLGGFDGLAVEDDYPGSAFDGIEGNTPAPDAGSASPGGKP